MVSKTDRSRVIRALIMSVLWVILFVILFLFQGCATPEVKTVYVPQEIKVPMAVACLQKDKMPQRPSFALDDPQVMMQSSYKKVLAMLAELEQRRAYEETLESLLNFCVK